MTICNVLVLALKIEQYCADGFIPHIPERKSEKIK